MPAGLVPAFACTDSAMEFGNTPGQPGSSIIGGSGMSHCT
jgi:hypothetical protein